MSQPERNKRLDAFWRTEHALCSRRRGATFRRDSTIRAPAEARMGKTGRARRLAAPVSSRDHVRGSPLAKVTLVGYGDFTCPDCAKSYRTVKKIQAEMGSRLRYVFRSFLEAPLDKESEGAAEAAESAGAQGKFWEIHDRMFENQGAADQLHLAKHAEAIGLDARSVPAGHAGTRSPGEGSRGAGRGRSERRRPGAHLLHQFPATRECFRSGHPAPRGPGRGRRLMIRRTLTRTPSPQGGERVPGRQH